MQAASNWVVVVLQCDFIVCPKLKNPLNGTISMSGVVIGSNATLNCNLGYVASQAATVTCQSDGTWDSDNLVCHEISCETPNAFSNVIVSAPVTTYLATATFSCDPGYNLTGQSSTICQANGTWSGTLPTCNPVNCGTPSVPTNGNFSSIMTTYLSTATYSCNSGYTMTGQNTTACLANGTWSGILPICLPISCETPSAPLNGNMTAPVTTYLATAIFSCDSGYIMSGQNSTTCQANGTWNGTLPTCNPVNCEAPPVPSNCNFTASGTTYLQTVVYTCYSGYLLIGEKNSTCQANMTWSGTVPTCQPVDCGQPSVPTNGSVLATNTTYLHQALYECNFGYRLEGLNTSVCLSNGSWSDSVPSCVFIYCTVPAPPLNGSVNLTGTTYLARADFYCDTGYNLIGQSERFCQNDDTWNGTDPRCDPVYCGNQTAPVNGSVIVGDTTYLNAAVYQCDTGFLLNGQNTSVCQANGLWNVDVPVCDPVNCGNLTDPVNGTVSVMKTTYTSVASYHCNFGYRLDGENTTTCLSNSSWSYAKPNCTMIGCGPLNDPDNGFVFMPDGTDIGAQATYSCKPGFKRSHSKIRSCANDKQWSGNEPSCEKRKYKKLYIAPCLCYPNKTFEHMTTEEILEKLENDTKIDPKKTAAARNKLESTYDRRPSSAIIGAVGVSILATVFGLIICADLINIYNHFKGRNYKKAR